MTTTANMSLVLPVEGSSGSVDVWGSLLNTIFGLIDAHDHTTGKGVRIPSAALKIDADVMWASSGTNYAITDLLALDFTPQAAADVTDYASALFVSSADSNLYFRNSLGTNVKITDGSTLNVSIVGGIGGDYSTVGALVDYDDANDTYRFRQETSSSVRQYAKVATADLILREYIAAGGATVPVNAVTIKSPASLAASYSVTMPAALPASTLAMQMDSSGNISASNTFDSALTATDFKHSSARGRTIAAMEAVDPNGTHTRLLGGTSGAQVGWTIAASTNVIAFPVSLDTGTQITAFAVRVNKTSDATNTISARLYSLRTSTLSTETAQGSGASNSADDPGYISISESSLAVNVASGFQYYIVITPGGATGDTLYNCEVNYTRPA